MRQIMHYDGSFAVKRRPPQSALTRIATVSPAGEKWNIRLCSYVIAGFLCLHQVRREVVARLVPAQLKQLLEVIRHTKIESILLLDFGGAERGEIEQALTRRELAWKISRSPSGIPSMSQMTVTGSRYAKSAIRSIWPRGST